MRQESRSTFYVHFADKTALLTSLVADAVKDLFAVAGEWISEDDTDGSMRLTDATSLCGECSGPQASTRRCHRDDGL